jgi:hypothetical protein
MNEAQLLAKRADYKTSHILHLILSIITAGIWVPIWILVAISNASQRAAIDRKLAGGTEDGGILGWLQKRKKK